MEAPGTFFLDFFHWARLSQEQLVRYSKPERARFEEKKGRG
jgi:hypothetical protein